MDQFYVGSNKEYIEAAYAPTGRATCKACKEKIAVQTIRLSYNIDSGHFSSTHWYHLNCFELKPKFGDIDIEQQIYNLDQIDQNQADLQSVIDYIQAEKDRLKKGEKRPKLVLPAKKTGQDKAQKVKKKDQSSESEDDASDSKGGKKRKKQVKKSQKQANKLDAPRGYTAEQQKQYDELYQKYSGQSVESLKQLLTKNGQSRTGSKAELADKCADGKILGQIPHCPSCGGGRPKFSKETGTYKCSGYMDDDKYRHCHKTFQRQEIQRQKWID